MAGAIDGGVLGEQGVVLDAAVDAAHVALQAGDPSDNIHSIADGLALILHIYNLSPTRKRICDWTLMSVIHKLLY